ncbi:hypothetical protein LHEH8_00550 [Lactobacillus helveticus]|uniref:HTH lysR-type domain-containing protein n=1 Tax=Lactobacillus helveticus TaxID=1587 RepID=A0A8H9KH65_LACHE|nr:hypothetical protein IV62_GL000167 [Lactobacillus helveticus]GFO98299.1 hypothetical protein LHEH8_00550 [Lactobacillus helveticus]GFP01111.1 hypothetical protein LHEW6_09440 [Lactobacillus helveticus]GFP02701.1 hypothetical protein LHEY10_06300 [Lactobacillus helveticus]GFP04137.1 hypothetical protein LMG22465_01500 [Lactobacillus helveticus]
MELRVLNYFVATAQELNMTRAAQKLLVLQPALSRQIADLETNWVLNYLTGSHVI